MVDLLFAEELEEPIGLIGVDIDEPHKDHVRGGARANHLIDHFIYSRTSILSKIDDVLAGVPKTYQSLGDWRLEGTEGHEAVKSKVVHRDIGEL